jgi:hypothetical protein
MTLFPCKLVYSALLGLDSTFPKLHKNVAKKISHATQQVLFEIWLQLGKKEGSNTRARTHRPRGAFTDDDGHEEEGFFVVVGSLGAGA